MVVVGLYFFISVGSMAKRVGVRSLLFLWMLDCWDWTVDCGRSDALLFIFLLHGVRWLRGEGRRMKVVVCGGWGGRGGGVGGSDLLCGE